MIQLFSPAKINLFFKLNGQREDGYHNLQSFFQAVSLGDTLVLKHSQKDSFKSNVEHLGFNDHNSIIKALFLFREETGITFPLDIFLDKKIPTEAGLGGGSSNAATTLWGLNELFGRPASLETLFNWAMRITSDSSFFFSAGTALCEGRGELVQNMPALSNESVWLVKPSQGLSTQRVYAESKAHTPITNKLDELLKRIYSKTPIYSNDLEAPAFALYPELKTLKQELIEQNFDSVFMTGSGSTLVCIGKNRPVTKKTVQIFPVRYINRPCNQWYVH